MSSVKICREDMATSLDAEPQYHHIQVTDGTAHVHCGMYVHLLAFLSELRGRGCTSTNVPTHASRLSSYSTVHTC